MTGWKKFLLVAVVCLLLLGLMLYGDFGRTGGHGNSRTADYGSATVNDRISGKVIEKDASQVADIVNLFGVTQVGPVIDPQLTHDKGVNTQEYISSYLYYDNALTRDRYAASPRAVEDWINLRVWGGRERLVNPADPERSAMRASRASELGTTVQAIEDFVRRGTAAVNKQNQFTQCVGSYNRADLAMLYLINHERARMRYMEFPAADYLEQARAAVAAKPDQLKARYEKDKLNPRTNEGETGQSMSRPLKLQFDVFYIESEAFFEAEANKITKGDVLKEYNKQRQDYETNKIENVLVKDRAEAVFKNYVPHDKNVKPLAIDPDWAAKKDKNFLSPEDAVLDYIKYVQMVPRALLGRSATVIREFSDKYNQALTAAKPEDRAEMAPGFLARLRTSDAEQFEAKWQFVKYLRTDLADFKPYAVAKQVQLSPETKTPQPLNTFFAQVANHNQLPEFQTRMSVPLAYTITEENGKELPTAKSGGSLVFQVHAVENADPVLALMAFEEPEAQKLLIERLSREEAPKLASAAAEATRKEWLNDPAKIPTDPKVLKEFVEPQADAQEVAGNAPDQRLRTILGKFQHPVNPTAGPETPDPEPTRAGQLCGPVAEPFEAGLSDAATQLKDCYVIGFIAEFHQVADPLKRVTADAGWRSGREPGMLKMALRGYPEYGYPGLSTKMIRQSVTDSYTTTVTPPKTEQK